MSFLVMHFVTILITLIALYCITQVNTWTVIARKIYLTINYCNTHVNIAQCAADDRQVSE